LLDEFEVLVKFVAMKGISQELIQPAQNESPLGCAYPPVKSHHPRREEAVETLDFGQVDYDASNLARANQYLTETLDVFVLRHYVG